MFKHIEPPSTVLPSLNDSLYWVTSLLLPLGRDSSQMYCLEELGWDLLAQPDLPEQHAGSHPWLPLYSLGILSSHLAATSILLNFKIACSAPLIHVRLSRRNTTALVGALLVGSQHLRSAPLASLWSAPVVPKSAWAFVAIIAFAIWKTLSLYSLSH